MVEFILAQASNHDVSDNTLNKDLLQMGVAVDNAGEIMKAFTNNHELLVKTMQQQSMRISKLENVDYKISLVMASSMSGKKLVEKEG